MQKIIVNYPILDLTLRGFNLDCDVYRNAKRKKKMLMNSFPLCAGSL